MINKQELSKHKYIYRIYASDDKVIHCEKYPVVYSNSEVIYFKDARKKEHLNYTMFRNVKEEYLGITSNDVSSYGYYDHYFWKVENFNSEKATSDVFEQKKKSELENAESTLRRAEQEYLRAKAILEKIKSKSKL